MSILFHPPTSPLKEYLSCSDHDVYSVWVHSHMESGPCFCSDITGWNCLLFEVYFFHSLRENVILLLNLFFMFLSPKALCFFMLTMTVAWHRDLVQTGKVRLISDFFFFLTRMKIISRADYVIYWRQMWLLSCQDCKGAKGSLGYPRTTGELLMHGSTCSSNNVWCSLFEFKPSCWQASAHWTVLGQDSELSSGTQSAVL